ncbi:hypothetical protein BDV96DRAFT_604001 [Lophiotrema nucula]|uniref:Uncharacterized protein n=1 Tax=Lophiotrema nucula TaxID=690887 RepID=A0A6A5YTF7_9PLEO|nr:hypothetical protein BDV96DRAFT_604001 [Lophiotrema nucula]
MAGNENVSAGRRSKMQRKVSMMTMWSSVAFALASAISINQATSAMEFITRVDSSLSIEITAGKTLNILQWLLFAFSTLFAAGVSSIFTREGGTIRSTGSSDMAGASRSNAGMGRVEGFGGGPHPPPPPPPPPPPVRA